MGQGDALVLHAAPGQAVIVDAGPDPALVDACLSRLSLHAVPLLFITHPHADHLAGLPGIPRARTLSTLVHTSLSPATAELRALRTAGLRPVSHTPAPRPAPFSLRPDDPRTAGPPPFPVRYPSAFRPAGAAFSGMRTHAPFEHGRLTEAGSRAGLRVVGTAAEGRWGVGEKSASVGPRVVSAAEEHRRAGEPGASAGPRVVGTVAGERWRAGELEIEVLAPRSRGEVPEGAAGTEVNNASLVLVARWSGLTVLLGGDLEEEGQRGLHGLVPRVDVLKVPHHGSARQEQAFLAEGRPRVALISVGRDNGYGHPSDRLLRMLRGVRVYRTDLHGDIAVTVSPRGLEVVTRS
ncbi:ComEC/Rec2 family competence protein [Actinocorallia aurantiaca]|uniref:Metallo-beta-lactamase domain-containing protein n=1 Tax=Actinocorallia aurantiaca TaxID=46204 RepID=A0ABN3UJH5_9ACTN